MSMLKKIILVASLIILTGQGCTLWGDEEKAKLPDGGVYISADKGVTWQARNAIPTTSGKPASIALLSIATLTLDPQDHNAWYAGASEAGLIFTYEQGNGWMRAKDVKGTVASIAVDRKDKCTIYVAAGKTIMKSEDCSRTYRSMYAEPRPDLHMTSVLLDPLNTKIVYAGSSGGDLIKSIDGGKTWAVLNRFGNEIKQISVNPHDTKNVYVGLAFNGIYTSWDSGNTWANITPDKKFDGASRFKALAWDVTAQKTFYMATQYGLFRTTDGGDSWEPLKLVTAPGEVNIYSIAVHPKNGKEIVYATANAQASTLFVTTDGGATWSIKKGPTRRAISRIIIDSESPHQYMVSLTSTQQ